MKTNESSMAELFDAFALALKEKLEDKDISSSDLNVVRQFLKDNNIQCERTQENPLGQLVDSLPEFDEDGNVIPIGKAL